MQRESRTAEQAKVEKRAKAQLIRLKERVNTNAAIVISGNLAAVEHPYKPNGGPAKETVEWSTWCRKQDDLSKRINDVQAAHYAAIMGTRNDFPSKAHTMRAPVDPKPIAPKTSSKETASIATTQTLLTSFIRPSTKGDGSNVTSHASATPVRSSVRNDTTAVAPQPCPTSSSTSSITKTASKISPAVLMGPPIKEEHANAQTPLSQATADKISGKRKYSTLASEQEVVIISDDEQEAIEPNPVDEQAVIKRRQTSNTKIASSVDGETLKLDLEEIDLKAKLQKIQELRLKMKQQKLQIMREIAAMKKQKNKVAKVEDVDT